MKKGIYPGNGLNFYTDLPWLVNRGFDTVLIGDDIVEKRKKVSFALECGIKTLILDISCKSQWKQIVDEFDVEYYYIDEPYTMGNHTEEELKEYTEYIKQIRPNSKFVIGDLRVIQEKKYKPIENLHYVFTSYTNNWLIPIWDKCIAIGGPNQSPSVKRIHKKTEGKVPWIWIYGQNKIFCHPDEYDKLYKTAEELNIPILMLYFGDGTPDSKYQFNRISEEEVMDNIYHFIHNEKPYTFFEWWKRFFHRWSLSFNQLFKTWDFKEFIDKLF
jgi:hypothetical protein